MTSPRRTLHAALLCLTTVSLVAAGAIGHEFWVSPSAYRVGGGELVRVSLFHGERFAGDVVARNDPMIKRFEFRTGGGVTDIRGMHGASSSFLRPASEGHGVIVYETLEYINPLPAEEFEAYLAEEGLDEISERRAALGETDTDGREAYVRCAKALLTVGDSGDFAGESGPVGLPFEIVVVTINEDRVEARLLFEGEPVGGRRVVVASASDHEDLIELESDSEGLVRFSPEHGGAWMLTALHMERVSEQRDDVDWKSYWASTTFALPDGLRASGVSPGGGA